MLYRRCSVICTPRRTIQPTQHFPKSPFPEQVWCKLRKKNREELYIILIGVCYRSPTTSIYNNNIDISLIDLLNELAGKHFVFMGDFNYPDIDWNAKHCPSTASKETQLFWNCCEDNFFVQHVTAV